ncbi:hypothetical protein DDZ13_11235 [Coraliomargarita sinensis]|uniref:Gcp-like domain-containing protein n=1 Tax=Coraliomargarita sinensis TaxID=2174842 RepID=A0A317ZIF4_9BACT|nr:hypothetical protein [Coraliomargarita sinensis]PXA03549.1 hypothetical protein DDZ13_11235 [Coraliomargarita sinensis]
MKENTEAPAYPALVVDGSSSCFFSGILGKDGEWLASKTADEPALESLFTTVDEVLKSAGLKLEAIESYIYCEGPGSVLGLRLCAMAIETWRRIQGRTTQLYSYNSLKLVAARLLSEGEIKESTLLISDWKKDTWNSLQVEANTLNEVTPIHAGELSQWEGPVYHLPARKGWQKAPDNTVEIAYEPKTIPKLWKHSGLFEPRSTIELYNSGINTFQKWTPQRHRATPEQSEGGRATTESENQNSASKTAS